MLKINNRQYTIYKKLMNKVINPKPYDLEERTALFAENCRDFTRKLPKTTPNFEYAKQLIRSSGSQAANYIEANEALGDKDFSMKIRICRKETKETCLWLRLCDVGNDIQFVEEKELLIKEGMELRKIFTSILERSKPKFKN